MSAQFAKISQNRILREHGFDRRRRTKMFGEATVFLNEPTYPYFMSLSVSNLRDLRLFGVRVVETNHERVSFIINKNSFVMIDLKEVSEQYNVKRKIVILM